MRAVLDRLSDTDEIGLVGCGQSNRRPWGHRDREGFVEAPHLALRDPGLDLTIHAMVRSDGAAHGGVGTVSVVTVGEDLLRNDWVGGELRLVHHEYGDSVTSSLRRGHATVLSNEAPVSAVVGFSTTSNTVLWTSHGRANGSQVIFATTGALPGLTAGTVYWVVNAAEHTFQVALDPFGAPITLSGGSGTHLATGRGYLVVQWMSECQNAPACTFTIGTPGVVNVTGHGYTQGSAVQFAGTVPPELSAATTYYVVLPATNSFYVSATYGGTPINFSGTGGAATVSPALLANVSGYVHLHDTWTSYENVQVVTPYQPIEAGDYPAGTPSVPGVTLASDVTSYADLALVLPFTFHEGIEGYGAVGTATASSLTLTLQGGQTIADKLFAGGYVRYGSVKGKVVSNTTTTITVEAWIGGDAPAGPEGYHLHLPHWRNNPHHYSAGEGFLYPSNDMQPGGASVLSPGWIYSRPRGRLTGSYTGRLLAQAEAGLATTSTKIAQCVTRASGQIAISIASGNLRVQRTSTTRNIGSIPLDAGAGLIQFEDFLRVGHIVQLLGTGQTPNVDGVYRVAAMAHTYGAAGSYIDLTQLDATTPAVPAAVSGTVPTAATVTRLFYEPQYRFGSLIVAAWRMAVAIGRRIVAIHLGINSSGQILRNSNNQFGFQGRIGWRDDDESLDWTPSNPNGNAARLKRLLQFIAPRAVAASLGASQVLKVLAIDIWQAEADALSAAGRQLAPRSLPTFSGWLRGVIDAAGLSPYPKAARIPLQWAQVSHIPYELSGTITEYPGFVFSGDSGGLVNKAITRMVALDGFMASVEVNDSPKLDGTTCFGSDPLHYNGIGEARNGLAAADAMLELIDFAFAFDHGASAVDVCNEALTILGEAAIVTSIDPPDGSQQSKLCATFYSASRDAVLQYHPWTFATKRLAAVPIDNLATTKDYAYAVPPDLLRVNAVLDPEAIDDLTTQRLEQVPLSVSGMSGTETASQPYRIESENGNRVLRTNQKDAVLVYVSKAVDPGAYDPLVRQAFAWHLAHLLAGSIQRGKEGAAAAQQCLQMAMGLLAQAAAANGNGQTDVRPTIRAEWLP